MDAISPKTQRELENELLQGLEGDDVLMTASDWDDTEREARALLDAKKPR
jgi:hypothetical protein